MTAPMNALRLLRVHGVTIGIHCPAGDLQGKSAERGAEQTTGRATFVPLVFQSGEAFQFDWSEDWANIGGERVKLQVAHIKLSDSRAFLVRAYPLQTHEMLFDAHWHAFRVFGGVPGRGIYDNMKTAVDRVGKGKQRDINARFKAMASVIGGVILGHGSGGIVLSRAA